MRRKEDIELKIAKVNSDMIGSKYMFDDETYFRGVIDALIWVIYSDKILKE